MTIRVKTKVIQRDEVYPIEYLSGCPAYSLRQAECVKAQQERFLNDERSTVDIHLEIKPVPEREGEYYVHNTSTYVKYISSLDSISSIHLPPWAEKTPDGNIKFLSIAPFYN